MYFFVTSIFFSIARLNNWFRMVIDGKLHQDPFAPRLVELLAVQAVVSTEL